MMNCESAMRRLWEYLDGEMPPDEHGALGEHLATCARCYPHYRFQLRFLAALVGADASSDAPHQGFAERLRTRLAAGADTPA